MNITYGVEKMPILHYHYNKLSYDIHKIVDMNNINLKHIKVFVLWP